MTAAMSDSMLAAADATVGRWGVWDVHQQEWLHRGLADEREAWQALLATTSLHPWELSVKQEDPPPPTAEEEVSCPTCDGDGDCYRCGTQCPDCDGTRYVTAAAAEQLRKDGRGWT